MSDLSRRSNRSRKAVDYSKLDSVGSDDDDFKDSSPPTKRLKQKNEDDSAKKTEKKRKKEVLKEIQMKEISIPVPVVKRKERVPVTEKVFERHLQVALELSATSDTVAGLNKEEPVDAIAIPCKEENVIVPCEGEHEIGASRSSAMPSRERIDCEGNSDRNFDSDASDWSDTEKNSKTKLKKKERTIAKAEQPDEKQKRVQTTRIRNQTKVHQERTLIPKPSPSITLPGGIVKIPNTGLRLGLSRKVALKPLHPVVRARH